MRGPFARGTVRLRLSAIDSRRVIDVLGPMLAAEAAQRRQRRRRALLAALLVAALILGLGAWMAWRMK